MKYSNYVYCIAYNSRTFYIYYKHVLKNINKSVQFLHNLLIDYGKLKKK